MKLLSKILAVSAITIASMSANAEIITSDWKVEGDNGTVLDTNSGITWLQLNHTTVGMQTVLDRMVAGGSLEGWSFANRAQIDSLWANGIGYVYQNMNKVPSGRYVAARWYNEVRDNIAFIGTRQGVSWHDLDGYVGANQYGWWVVKGGGSKLSQTSSLYALPENYVDASVPLPATAALLGLGLLGFGARRKNNS
jgi:hypothetical protein